MNHKERLQNVFRDVFDDEELVLSESMTAEDVDDWDSLTHIQLMVAVETEFDIRFSTVEVQRLKNVGDLLSLIGSKLNG